jgi:transposase
MSKKTAWFGLLTSVTGLGFREAPNQTGRPPCNPKTLFKIYIYGYLNRVQSSRRLERVALRNVELMWVAGRFARDFKIIAIRALE